MHKPTLSLAVALLTCSTLLGQPPRTRPGAGESPQPSPSESPNATEWPRLREPGERRPEGQRYLRQEARGTARVAPSVAPPSQNWFFGVYPERAPRGVRITQVIGGSAAQRFGMEPGDYILDVGGYVVGEYQGTFYPLSMAMDYGADANGWAEILVWNKRTFQEELMWVQFQHR